MSNVIDTRVVDMQFDSKQFVQNISMALSAISKLKNALIFKNAGDGLEKIDDTIKKVDVSRLGKAVDAVGKRFSALEVVGVTALVNIANAAVNAGKRILRSLTIAPVSQGLKEYELKMGSVQTIMASTGESLETVNGYLNELNKYADRTIYSFSDMTQNIGKFTNAGVELKDAVKAIQGISNEAALSGANANEASRAMYNFAQALSAGYVKLIDWKSIENANMATKAFKQTLIDTAVALGTVTKEEDGMYKTLSGHVFNATRNFNDELREQWMTTEVLVKTLGMYADETTDIGKKAFAAAQDVKTFTQLLDTLAEAAGSGWAETGEILIGDFNEAKDLWTSVSKIVGGIIDGMSDTRNDFLRRVFSTGWKNFLRNGINNVESFEDAMTEVARKHKITIDDYLEQDGTFQKTLRRGWLNSGDILLEGLDSYIAGLMKLNTEQLEAEGYTWANIAALKHYVQQLKDGTIFVDEIIEKINRLSGREQVFEAISNLFKGIGTIIAPIRDAWNDIFGNMDSEKVYTFTDALRKFTETLKLSEDASNDLKKTFEGIFSIFKLLKDVGLTLFKAVFPFIEDLGTLGEAILKVTGYLGSWVSGMVKVIEESGIFTTTINGISGILHWFVDAIELVYKAASEKLKFPSFEDFSAVIKSISEGLLKVLKVFDPVKKAIIGFFSEIFGFIQRSNLLGFLSDVATGLVDLVVGAFQSLQKVLSAIDLSPLLEAGKTAGFVALSMGVRKLAASFKKLVSSVMDGEHSIFDKIFKPIEDTKIFEVLDQIKVSLVTFQSTLQAKTLLQIGEALALMAGSLLLLSAIPSEKVASVLGEFTVLLAGLVTALRIFCAFSSKNIKTLMVAIVAVRRLAMSVLILAGALAIIGTIDKDKLLGATVALQSLIFSLTLMAKFMSTTSRKLHVEKFAAQMVGLSVAIGILAGALKIISSIETNKLFNSMLAIEALIATLAILSQYMSSGKKLHMLKFAQQMIGLSIAVSILAGVVKMLGDMDIDALVKGGTAVVAGIASLTIAMEFLNGVAVGKVAAQMIGFSIAVGILAGVAKIMEDVSWTALEKTGVSLLAFATVFTAAAKLLSTGTGISKFSGQMMVLAVSLGLLAGVAGIFEKISWDAIGKEFVVLAGALTLLGVAGKFLQPFIGTMYALGGAFALVGVGAAGLGVGILALSAGLIALAGGGAALATSIVSSITIIFTGLLTLLPTLFGALIKSILDNIKGIGEAISALLKVLGEALGEAAPELIKGLVKFLLASIRGVADYTSELVEALFDILIGIIDGVTAKLPELIDSVVQMFEALFKGIADALMKVDASTLTDGVSSIKILMEMMLKLTALTALSVGALAGAASAGLVVTALAGVLAAFGALSLIPGLGWLMGKGGDFIASIGKILGGAVGGFTSGFASAAAGKLTTVADELIDFATKIEPFVAVCKTLEPSSFDGLYALGETLGTIGKEGFFTQISEFIFGESNIDAFGEKLLPFANAMVDFSNALSGMQPNLVTSAATAGEALANMFGILEDVDISEIFGKADMKSFANKILIFGNAMTDYSNAISGFNAAGVESSVKAGEALVSLGDTLTRSGGVLQKLIGDKDLSSFASGIKKLGEALAGYSESVSSESFDVAAITASVDAASALAGLYDVLPRVMGVVQMITGVKDLGVFGSQLKGLGDGIREFQISIIGVDAARVTAGANAAAALAAIDTPKLGGLISFFTGDEDLTKFGTQLAGLGQGMADFQEKIQDVDIVRIQLAAVAVQTLADIAVLLTPIIKEGTVTSAGTGLDSFSTAISGLGTSLASFSESIVDVDFSRIVGAANVFHTLADAFMSMTGTDPAGVIGFKTAIETLSTITLSTMVNSFVESGPALAEAVSTMLMAAIEAINAKASDFNMAGSKLAEQFKMGIENSKSRFGVKKAAMTIVNEVFQVFSSKASQAQNYGLMFVQGFANGIALNTYIAKQAAAAMAAAALASVAGVLASSSPSKETFKLGGYFTEGFTNGINSLSDSAKKAGGKIASSALEGLNETIKTIDDMIDTDITADPVIRPVVDLSDVRDKTSQLTSLFGETRAIGISSRMRDSALAVSESEKLAVAKPGNFIFTQNNYSPKALSRLEIYRQTSNQFAAMKSALGS